MSRHYFDTFHKGFSVTVLLGWDRPMNYFFLVIEKPTELIDDTMKVDRVRGPNMFAQFDPRQGQQIRDQSRHALGLTGHDGQKSVPGILVILGRAPHRLDKARQRSQRRAQFMARISQKV